MQPQALWSMVQGCVVELSKLSHEVFRAIAAIGRSFWEDGREGEVLRMIGRVGGVRCVSGMMESWTETKRCWGLGWVTVGIGIWRFLFRELVVRDLWVKIKVVLSFTFSDVRDLEGRLDADLVIGRSI